MNWWTCCLHCLHSMYYLCQLRICSRLIVALVMAVMMVRWCSAASTKAYICLKKKGITCVGLTYSLSLSHITTSQLAALYILICLLSLFFLQANKKTRNRAYEILVQIGHACGDEEKGGNRENLFQFFSMVLLIQNN